MQCFLKSKYIKSRTFNDKNRWIIKKVMVIKKLLPHLATRGTYSPGDWRCDEAWREQTFVYPPVMCQQMLIYCTWELNVMHSVRYHKNIWCTAPIHCRPTIANNARRPGQVALLFCEPTPSRRSSSTWSNHQNVFCFDPVEQGCGSQTLANGSRLSVYDSSCVGWHESSRTVHQSLLRNRNPTSQSWLKSYMGWR